jgi:hypothetical protein
VFESLAGDILGSLANSSSLNRRRERGIEFLYCDMAVGRVTPKAGFSAAQDSEKGEKRI